MRSGSSKDFPEEAMIRQLHAVYQSKCVFHLDPVGKGLSPMPFFIAEFSLAPLHLATHHNTTNWANLPPPHNDSVATGSNANVSGASIKRRVAGNKAADNTASL